MTIPIIKHHNLIHFIAYSSKLAKIVCVFIKKIPL